MRLNVLAGRSFRDQTFYPVMPPVISDLRDPKSLLKAFRNLNSGDPPIAFESLEEAFTGRLKVLAEFYFDASVLPAALPPWATSPHEFVYTARKLLESAEIAEALPEWINLVFTARSKECPMARTLFTRPHPPRGICAVPRFEFRHNLGRSIKWAHVYRVSRNRLRFGYVTDDFSAFFVRLDLSTSVEEIVFAVKIPVRNEEIVFADYSDIIGYCRARSTLFLLRCNKPLVELPFASQTALFANMGGLVVFVREQGCIARCSFREGGAEVAPICFVPGRIAVLAVSGPFQIAAFATSDGFLHIHDCGNGASLLAYDTRGEVSQIVITSGWGFVVALLERTVIVCSANGECLKRHELGVPIRKLFPHTSTTGFDFVAFADADDRIGVFEAFYPDRQIEVAVAQGGVVRIGYDRVSHACIVFRANGMLASFLLPYEFLGVSRT
jgi:hypothetical protein